jgi:capsule polysaccharide export protein KpsE/RkpR
MESQFYQINILKLILRWKYHIVVIVAAATLLAVIFSSSTFITPKFKSNAVVYPANISPYSDETETEQMLQVMQSKDIRDNVIRKFNLAKHYGLDSTMKYFQSAILYEYSQNIRIAKTPFDAVSIEVLDKDPQTACDITKAIIDFYNLKVRSLHESKFQEVVRLYDRTMKKKKAYLDSLENRLYELSTQYGLLDYVSQSREVTKGFLRTVDGGGMHVNSPEVLKLKDNIEKKGGELVKTLNLIDNESVRYTELKLEADRAYMDFDRKFTYTNVITEPFPADKKASPIRWLIVVVTLVASFFLSVIVIAVLENYKSLLAKSAHR